MADMTLAKTYDFKPVERRWYAEWERSGYFRPTGEGAPFVISMPPPNITDRLHVGHAMFVATEDLMIRHARMTGVPTLWVPGTDHASIATELQIEKELVAKGIPQAEIESVGMGSERPLVKPDNTPAKKAKNRRYEIQMKL